MDLGEHNEKLAKVLDGCHHEYRPCEWGKTFVPSEEYDHEFEERGKVVTKVFCIHCLEIKELTQ